MATIVFWTLMFLSRQYLQFLTTCASPSKPFTLCSERPLPPNEPGISRPGHGVPRSIAFRMRYWPHLSGKRLIMGTVRSRRLRRGGGMEGSVNLEFILWGFKNCWSEYACPILTNNHTPANVYVIGGVCGKENYSWKWSAESNLTEIQQWNRNSNTIVFPRWDAIIMEDNDNLRAIYG